MNQQVDNILPVKAVWHTAKVYSLTGHVEWLVLDLKAR